MKKQISDSIKDTFDAAMNDYLNSSTYKEERQNINSMFLNLRKELSDEQASRLNEILNTTDNSDNQLALNAYVTGFFLGMSIRDEYTKLL